MLTDEELAELFMEFFERWWCTMTQKDLKELKDKWFDTGKTKDDDSVLENGNKTDEQKKN